MHDGCSAGYQPNILLMCNHDASTQGDCNHMALCGVNADLKHKESYGQAELILEKLKVLERTS